MNYDLAAPSYPAGNPCPLINSSHPLMFGSDIHYLRQSREHHQGWMQDWSAARAAEFAAVWRVPSFAILRAYFGTRPADKDIHIEAHL